MLQNAVDYFRKQNISKFFTGARVETPQLPQKTLRYEAEDDDEDLEFEDLELESADTKIANRAMYFSLVILAATIFFNNRDSFHLSMLETCFGAVRKAIARQSWYLLPILCGFLTSVFTSFIVYKDSRVPGEDPPTPFSPSHKYRRPVGPSFHLNYLFAVGVGLLVFAQMLYQRL